MNALDNIIKFEPDKCSVNTLRNIGYTRSKIVKIKHLTPHIPVQPIKSIDDINKCKQYF